MKQPLSLYYENRTMPVFGTAMPVASDIARHLQSRQFLGMTVVVCEHPVAMLSSTRKQWLRLARNLQKQRASTLNTEEILRFTHSIMHMQHLQFAARIPTEHTEAHIFFATPAELTTLPPGCLTLYVTTPPPASRLHAWLNDLAADALVIDYDAQLGLAELGLQPKEVMERRMLDYWQDVVDFLQKHHVHLASLTNNGYGAATHVDDALDALLTASTEFLRLTAGFQHMVSLSQPLAITTPLQREQFRLVMRLAHRVQSLTPGLFNSYLVQHFGDHNGSSFFLRDAAPEADDYPDDADYTERHLTADGAVESTSYYDMGNVELTTIFI